MVRPQDHISVNQDHEGFKQLWGTDSGFYARHLTISEHCGTHTDEEVIRRAEEKLADAVGADVHDVGIDNMLDDQFSAHKRFQLFGLPLNIEGGTGSPIRAIAWFPEA